MRIHVLKQPQTFKYERQELKICRNKILTEDDYITQAILKEQKNIHLYNITKKRKRRQY